MFGSSKKSRTFASAIEKQTSNSKCPDGGIGRRAGLKHQWIHFHPGSTPGLGTEEGEGFKTFSFFCIACYFCYSFVSTDKLFFTYIPTFSTLLLIIKMLLV